MGFIRIGGETTILYQDLLERLQTFEAMRNVASLHGEFVTKTVKGVLYHYFQGMLPAGREQIYIGRDSNDIRELIKAKTEGKEAALHDESLFQTLSSQIIAGNVPSLHSDMSRIIRRLTDCAFFRSGGVLVGSVAFHVLSTHLGVVTDYTIRNTQDIDIAYDAKVAIAVPPGHSNIPEVIDSLRMGFFPVPRLSHSKPSTSYAIRGKTLRIDLLAPMKRSESSPVIISRFKAAAQPLKYLDYLIENPLNAVVVSGTPCLVNVPQPARFALHKLIVSQERDVSSSTKKQKDMAQASQLLEILQEDRPGDIKPAIDAIKQKGVSWVKKLKLACSEAQITLEI